MDSTGYVLSRKRKVINKVTGRFGFVHNSAFDEEIEIYYPYPVECIVRELLENIDYVMLDGI